MDEEQQMDIVDANQPQADSSIIINKSWKHPTAAKQVIIQRDAARNNSTWLACTSTPLWNSLLRYHPPSSTLPALIGASAFAFNKYPHKPYIFWKLNSSRLLLIPFKKSKY